jgi:hypothetical protein
MVGAPDLTHTALAQSLDQPVAPEFACGGHVLSESVHDSSAGIRKADRDRRVHSGLEVRVSIRGDSSREIEQRESQRRHRAGGDGRCQHAARRAGHDQREQNDDGRNPGQIGQHLVKDVVLPERDYRDDEADRNLVYQANRVEAGRGHMTAACDPPQPGRCHDGRQIDQLKRACLEEAPLERITEEQC